MDSRLGFWNAACCPNRRCLKARRWARTFRVFHTPRFPGTLRCISFPTKMALSKRASASITGPPTSPSPRKTWKSLWLIAAAVFMTALGHLPRRLFISERVNRSDRNGHSGVIQQPPRAQPDQIKPDGDHKRHNHVAKRAVDQLIQVIKYRRRALWPE